MSSTLTKQKSQLRQSVLNGLRAMTSAQRSNFSARLRVILRKALPTTPRRIALYAALPFEVDLLPLLREAPQHHYAFPRCGAEGQMEFYAVSSEEDFELGAYGIRAPRAHCPLVLPEEFHYVIVPGVAFEASGARLGFGGGYYDRYLPRCPQAQAMSLAYPMQVVAEGSIPQEDHDCRLSQILLT